jgi:hypothetical protein
MHFKLYYSSMVKPFDSAANEGFGEVLELLERVERKGITCERVDTSKLTDEEIFNAYTRSVIGPTQLKKYKVRQVFGSARRSGWLFGKQVPALVVYGSSSSQVPEDIFPHATGGHTVTIREYLEKATRQNKKMGRAQSMP